jgi:hypothetical protein
VPSTQSETVTSRDFVSLSHHLFSLVDNQACEFYEAGAGNRPPTNQVGHLFESPPQDTSFFLDSDSFAPERGVFDLPDTFDDFFDLAGCSATNDMSLLPLNMMFVTR